MIDPAIWDSEQVMRLSPEQFKMYLFLVTQADDEGRLKVSLPIWKIRIFPFDNIDEKAIEKNLLFMHNIKLIQIYENSDQCYVFHPNWYKYQKISHPTASILPTPEDSRIFQINPEDSGQLVSLVSVDQINQSSMTPSAQGAEELVDNFLKKEQKDQQEDPEIPDDKLPERYQVIQDVLKAHYGIHLRLSDLDFLDRMFKHNAFPKVVCDQLIRKKKDFDAKGKDPPLRPIQYIYSYMKDWKKTMTSEEIRSRENPKKPQKKYYCPDCKRQLRKLDDGSYGCSDCKQFYSIGKDGKPSKLAVEQQARASPEIDQDWQDTANA